MNTSKFYEHFRFLNTFMAVTHHTNLWTLGPVNTICHMSHPVNTQLKWYSTLLPYASELCRLVSRLPSVKMFYISLSDLLSPGAPHPGWQTEIIQLLDLVVHKSCVLLSVAGGDGMAGDNASATGSQSHPTINPAERVRRLLGHFCGAMKSVIPRSWCIWTDITVVMGYSSSKLFPSFFSTHLSH